MDLHQLQLRNQELSILNAIAEDLNREVELARALDATLRQTVHLLNLKTGWIWLMNDETRSAYLAASHNLPPVFLKQPELLTGWCYCIDKYLTGNLENASNIDEITCSRLKNLEEGTEGLRFHASVPLFGSHGKIGIMNVVSADTQQLSEAQLQLLYTIGDMLSIAIERARLFENSKQLGVVQERLRLAREIHDTLAQGLSGISLNLETIKAYLEKNRLDKVGALIDRTVSLTKQNLEDARRSVLDLRATPLRENNLIEALEKLIENARSSATVNGHLKVTGTYKALDMRTELGLYRIAQEAIQNILKHAEAQRFWISIQYTAKKILLQIQDDGKGFEHQPNEAGMGLIGIKERVRILKGKLDIKSKKGGGTRINIELPIENDG